MEEIERQKNRLYWRKWALEKMKEFIKIYEKTKNQDIYESIQNLGIFARNHKEEGIDKLLSEKD